MKQLTMNDINAYMDGALSPSARREVEAALAADPAARELLNRYRRNADALHQLYDPVLEEPVPEKMLSLLRRHGSPRPH
ncbi:anti-sigma factor family protein [Niveispirillum irakense]|uniref:anti-sigma factor family protein n=1 Tax=Niveispirillum irakense TaxID=34011 RepID=UPI0004181C2D|nr:zf-HC2 domain-containing protein [Niveispirillum irakense]